MKQIQYISLDVELSPFIHGSSISTFTPQALCVELLPSGERAPEQLWRVPRRQGHFCGAAQCRRPDAAGANDGPGRRRAEPLGQKELEEVLQPVAPPPPALLLTVRHDTDAGLQGCALIRCCFVAAGLRKSK